MHRDSETETEVGISPSKANRIFRLDKTLRFVGLLSPEGEAVASFLKPGLTSLEPEEDTKVIFKRAAIATSMGASENKYHGRVRAAIVVRDRVILICFVLARGLIVISADPGFPLGKVEGLGQLVDRLELG